MTCEWCGHTFHKRECEAALVGFPHCPCVTAQPVNPRRISQADAIHAEATMVVREEQMRFDAGEETEIQRRINEAVEQARAEAGHRIDEPHDCFTLHCRRLGADFRARDAVLCSFDCDECKAATP